MRNLNVKEQDCKVGMKTQSELAKLAHDQEYRVRSCLPKGAELVDWFYANEPVDEFKQYDRRITFIYIYNGVKCRGNISAQSGGERKKKCF